VNIIFLTIAIPTYNRSEFLDNQIKRLIKIIQNNFFELQVELLILNNKSEDETHQLVVEYVKQYSFIKYIKNEFNIGLIGNYKKAFQNSSGKFTWVLGDDDTFEENLVPEMLSLIKNNPTLSFVHINQKIFDSKTNDYISQNLYGNLNSTNSLLNSGLINELFMRAHSGGFMFISANVIKTPVANAYIEKLRCFKNYLSFPLVLNTSIAGKGVFFYVNEPKVICVYNSHSWVDKISNLYCVELPRILFYLYFKKIIDKRVFLKELKNTSHIFRSNKKFLLKFNNFIWRQIYFSLNG
jgi:glycosyltransferase involved in cell wall biosynthesis